MGETIQRAGFALTPKVIISGVEVYDYGVDWYYKKKRRELPSSWKEDITALWKQNPFQTRNGDWVWVLRPSDWARGRGSGAKTRFILTRDQRTLEDKIIEMVMDVYEQYDPDHPFFITYGRVPGVIIEPLVANTYQSDQTDLVRYAPEISGVAFHDLPGAGTYTIVEGGLAGGTYGGTTIQEGDIPTDFEAKGKLVLGMDNIGDNFVFPQSQPLATHLNGLWERMDGLNTFYDHFYIEWAAIGKHMWLTQFAEVDGMLPLGIEPQHPILSTNRGIRGRGAKSFRWVALVGNSAELRDYVERQQRETKYTQIGKSPHVLMLDGGFTSSWAHLSQKSPESRQGMVAFVDLGDSHKGSAGDHAPSDLEGEGVFVAQWEYETGKIQVEEFPQAFTADAIALLQILSGNEDAAHSPTMELGYAIEVTLRVFADQENSLFWIES